MTLSQAVYLIRYLEQGIIAFGSEQQSLDGSAWGTEFYLPLADELALLRIRYNRYVYDPLLIEGEGRQQHDAAMELLLCALALLYSSLVLPLRCIDAIKEYKFEIAPEDDSHPVPIEKEHFVARTFPLSDISTKAFHEASDHFQSILIAMEQFIVHSDGPEAVVPWRNSVSHLFSSEAHDS